MMWKSVVCPPPRVLFIAFTMTCLFTRPCDLHPVLFIAYTRTPCAAWDCPSFPCAAVTALFYNVLHVALMIIALDAWRRQSRPLFAIPVSLHLVFTLMTFFNLGSGGTCIASLPLQALVLVGSIVLAVRVVRAPDYAATRQLRAWTLLVQTWEDNETQHGLGNNSNGGHRGGSAVSSGVAGGAGAGSLQRRAPATQATLPQQTR